MNSERMILRNRASKENDGVPAWMPDSTATCLVLGWVDSACQMLFAGVPPENLLPFELPAFCGSDEV